VTVNLLLAVKKVSVAALQRSNIDSYQKDLILILNYHWDVSIAQTRDKLKLNNTCLDLVPISIHIEILGIDSLGSAELSLENFHKENHFNKFEWTFNWID